MYIGPPANVLNHMVVQSPYYIELLFAKLTNEKRAWCTLKRSSAEAEETCLA